MKQEIKACLKKIGFLPINKTLWHTLKINHIKKNKNEWKKIRQTIKNKIGNKGGIYIYKNASNKILYIGEGKRIKDRLYMHHRASFEPVPGDTENMRWHRFWSKHKGKLTVYWKEQKNKRIQKMIEQMLEYVLVPKFVKFK
ncbi:MAG: hypothetical protein NC818_05690 [Candidatus Omnitrophica bacterium]|nr:hypothetical protein [Candidatus Omnitrophota bacterium]